MENEFLRNDYLKSGKRKSSIAEALDGVGFHHLQRMQAQQFP